ncbi:hypothetical protein BJ742DRAFT_824958 [Cladochytrium replicatum]|nr:hypothetical protein BJ742DRAFT_824958 [Cladochytrium replicatum]
MARRSSWQLPFYPAARNSSAATAAAALFLGLSLLLPSLTDAQTALEAACSATYAGIGKDFTSLSLASDTPVSLGTGALPCACTAVCSGKGSAGCDFAVYRSSTNPPTCQVFRLDKSDASLSVVTIFRGSDEGIIGSTNGGVVVSPGQSNPLGTCLQRCLGTATCDFAEFSAAAVTGGTIGNDTVGTCVLKSLTAANTAGATIVYRLVPLSATATVTRRTSTRGSSTRTNAKESDGPAPTQFNVAEQPQGGLSTGALIGVIAGSVVVGLGLAGGALFFVMKGRRARKANSMPPNGFGRGTYNDGGFEKSSPPRGYVSPIDAGFGAKGGGSLPRGRNVSDSGAMSPNSRARTISDRGGSPGRSVGGPRPMSQTTLYTTITDNNNNSNGRYIDDTPLPPLPSTPASRAGSIPRNGATPAYQIGGARSPSNGRRASSASNGTMFDGGRIDTTGDRTPTIAGVEFLAPSSASTVMSPQSASSVPTLQNRSVGGGPSQDYLPSPWPSATPGGGPDNLPSPWPTTTELALGSSIAKNSPRILGATNSVSSPKHMTVESLYSVAAQSMLPVARPANNAGTSITTNALAESTDSLHSRPFSTSEQSHTSSMLFRPTSAFAAANAGPRTADSLIRSLLLDSMPARTASMQLHSAQVAEFLDTNQVDEEELEADDILETKKTYLARYGFDATRDDELVVVPGDPVLLEKVYKDGWGTGVNSRSGAQGFFPVMVFGIGMGVDVIVVGQ